MNGTKKEIEEWITLGKRALRRTAPIVHSCKRPRYRVVREIVHINGNVIEYDRVIDY